jgi:1-deoxy-D-xylulose-5-phosphate reductoisomerase
VVVLGATGSIGTQAIEVVTAHPDRFEVVGLAAGRDGADARRAGRRSRRAAGRGRDPCAAALRAQAPRPRGARRTRAATLASADADLVVNGITGAVGLAADLGGAGGRDPRRAGQQGVLIVGGDLVVAAAERAGGRESHLIPVDSEHSALAQCLRGGRRDEVAGWC